MDPKPVKRCAECVQELHNPHFKPLWEPDTIVGRNAIRYSLAHHVYQQRISNAGLCGFCADELTRRVSEAARRFKARGLFHDERAFMDLFWQDTGVCETGDGDGADLVAGETIVALDKDGVKVSVADEAEELSLGMPTAWWDEHGLRFQGEIAAIDRSETVGSRGHSWVDRLGRREGRLSESTPWETRFVCVLWTFMKAHMEAEVSMATFVDWHEKYLNFTHENCQCPDMRRLRNGENFETVLMERVLKRIGAEVWDVIPLPSEDVWRNRGRFLTYFADQSSGTRYDESVWDYAYSRGEISSCENMIPGPLPQGWQRRYESANTVCYYDCHGGTVCRERSRPGPFNVPRAYDSYTVDEENLIDL